MNVKISKDHKIKVKESAAVARIIRQILLRDNLLSREREHFWVVGLDTGSFIVYIELVSLGTAKKTLVDPMEVFSFALQKHCSAIILVHNHPSGTMKPSVEDKRITDRLIQVGKIVGLEVYDHIIITSKTEEYLSFEDTGVMAELEESTEYVAPYKLVEKAKKLATEVAVRKTKIEMAKNLLKKKVDVKIIAQVSGMTVKEIEKL